MDYIVSCEVRVPGEGQDHAVDMCVVGLTERLPGFVGFSRDERYVRWGRSPAFVSLDICLRLTHDPAAGEMCANGTCSPMEREQPVIARVLATTTADAEETHIVSSLRNPFADRHDVWVRSTAEEIRVTEQSMRTMRILMLIPTVRSYHQRLRRFRCGVRGGVRALASVCPKPSVCGVVTWWAFGPWRP
ncbi:MAG: hypothetical protein N2508_13850 [Anaerolineae bacterium]|nr:hypothetical protein [Anaerolineae bacterium]